MRFSWVLAVMAASCSGGRAIDTVTLSPVVSALPSVTAEEPPPTTVSRCPKGFVAIPGGTFTMGSPDGEGDADEHPEHKVTVNEFCMQRLEVTVAEYETCIDAGVCTATGIDNACNVHKAAQRQTHPINCVDWYQAMAYCNYVGGRLPSEMEWEYAARGTDGRKYAWGNSPPGPTRLNACGDECTAYAQREYSETKPSMYSGNDGFEETAPVGSYPAGASPFGLLDIAGNVYEWTVSPYCSYPDHNCTSEYRMYRGGGWYTDKTAAAATRNGNKTSERSVVVGIRCAK
jgi:formylglycine-generating enzyme required for sulfatase activity